MNIWQRLLALTFFAFLPDILFLILGVIFVRTNRFHRFGVNCLARCMIIPHKFLPDVCNLNSCSDCKLWTCPSCSCKRKK